MGRDLTMLQSDRDVGTDRGGSLAGQGGRGKRDRKREDSRHALVVEGRTKVDEARSRFDPGGLADNDTPPPGSGDCVLSAGLGRSRHRWQPPTIPGSSH
jgi:hypothetical protein